MRNLTYKTLMLLGVLTPMAAGTLPARAADQVPFTATYMSTITFTSPSTATLSGRGAAIHLGEVTDDGIVTIVGPANCQGGFSVQNADVLTAANGDQLRIAITQQSCPIAPGVYQGAGSWTVTGGTGRFVDASGAGTFTGIGDFNTDTTTCTLSGSISTVGR
jgi:hypothetical protein